MEYTQGATGDVVLALDLNRDAYAGLGEGPDGALEYAVRIAAAAAGHLLGHGYVVRLVLSGPAPPVVLRRVDEMPRLLDTLTRAEAGSAQTLAEALRDNQAQAAGGKTLIFITPGGMDAALSAALQDCRALGARTFGFLLDAASFQGRPPGAAPGTEGDATLQWVRRGDDLQRAMEGPSYARR